MNATAFPHDWKRFLSLRYVVGKIEQRGVLWYLLKPARKLARLLVGLIALAVAYPLSLTRLRFITIASIDRIGHWVCEPDCYIKEGILGMRPQFFGITLIPRSKTANSHLLEYWRPHFSIITSPLLCSLLGPLSQTKTLKYDVTRYVSAINETAAVFRIQAKYGDRPPLLSLRKEDRERGWDCLRKLGIPDDAWFVCVHCREAGYVRDEAHDFRNTEIQSYVPAMKAIVDRGGWCIRLGDPTMKQLPPLEQIIDYAHRSAKSDWMDIFLCASCRFLLGSASGLGNLATVFGVPVAIANQSPLSVIFPFGPRDIGISKMVWSRDEKRLLTFQEILDSPIANFRYASLYEKEGVSLIDNSPDEIRDLALEMLNRVEGKAVCTAEDEVLQQRFKSMFKPGHYSHGAISQAGRDFLRKYSYLLGDQQPY